MWKSRGCKLEIIQKQGLRLIRKKYAVNQPNHCSNFMTSPCMNKLDVIVFKPRGSY